MKIPTLLYPALSVPLFVCILSGCATPGSQTAPSSQALLSRQANLSEELLRIQEELRSIKSKQEEYDYRLSDSALKKPFQEAFDRCAERISTLEKRLNEMEREMKANNSTWNKKMETIIEIVKSENTQLREAITGLQKSSVAGGWEHTVSAGETLGKIASEYGVSVKDIVEANDITDQNRIRVGRVLFIPRP